MLIWYYSQGSLKRSTESIMINLKRNANNHANRQKANGNKSAQMREEKNHDSSLSVSEHLIQRCSGKEWGGGLFMGASELMRKFNAAVTCPTVTKSTYNVIKSAKSALPWLYTRFVSPRPHRPYCNVWPVLHSLIVIIFWLPSVP